MKPRAKGKSRRLFLNALLAVLLASAGTPGSSNAQQSYPTPGGASGSQTGDGSAPFASMAADPSADLFTGSATVGLPIELPPGRGSLTPSLGLGYNSASSSSPGGAWGRGWSMTAARLHRSTTHGVPRYDTQDSFVLEMGGSSIRLVPGQGRLYRPAHGESALRAGFDQQANLWKVFDPTGLVHWFGATGGAGNNSGAGRIGPDPLQADGTFAWVILRTEDLFGNSIDYDWQFFGQGELLPLAVRYGGNQQIANFIELRFDYSPRLYPDQPRADYSAGFRREASVLLGSISTWVEERQVRRYELTHAVDAVTGAALLQSVGLTGFGWIEGTGASPADDVTMPPAVFAYAPTLQTGWPLGSLEQRANYAISFDGPDRIRDPRGEPKLELLDMTGDGLVDQLETGGDEVTLRRGNGRGFDLAVDWPSPVLNNIRDIDQASNIQHNIFDLDGDGLPDYVEADEANLCSGPGLPTAWCLHRNTGNGFSLAPQAWPAPSFDIRQADSNGDRVHVEIVDLNSDGLPDWVASWPWSTASPWWTVHWNTGAGFSAVPSQFAAPRAWIMQRHSPGDQGYLVSGLIDINGDGLPDFVDAAPSTWPNATGNYSPQEMSEQHWLVYFNNGSGFESQARSWGPGGNGGPGGNEPLLANYISHDQSLSNSVHSSSTASQELVDITGDGLPDLVAPITGSGQAHLDVLLCINGEAACQADPFNVVSPPICCLNNYLFVNNGSGFSDPQPLAWWSDSGRLRLVSTPPAVPAPSPQLNHDLLDFDGDGLVDLVELHRQPDGSNRWQVHLNPASPRAGWSATPDHLRTRPGAMVVMENGVGGVTQLEYSPVSMQDDEACQYDAQGKRLSGKCLPFPLWTLSRRTLFDVIDVNNTPVTSSWAYRGASWDSAGREFQGFASTVALQPSGLARFTYFHQDTARKGKVYRSLRLGNPACAAAASPPPGPACDPWNYLLDETATQWPDPTLLLAGAAPLAPVSQVTTPYRADSACGSTSCPLNSLVLTTLWQYDQHGNETRREKHSPSIASVISVGEFLPAGVPVLDPDTLEGARVVSRPSRLRLFENQESGTPLSDSSWQYGPQAELASESRCLAFDQQGDCSRWSANSFFYNSDGLLSREVLPTGGLRTIAYGGPWQLYPTVEKTAGGNRSYLSYDAAAGLLLQSTSGDGRRVRNEYDGLGRSARNWTPAFLTAEAPTNTTSYQQPLAQCQPAGGPCTSTRGHVKLSGWGKPDSVIFYDGLGREVATRTETARLGGIAVNSLLSGLKSYDSSGRVTAEALPFEDPVNTGPTSHAGLLTLDETFATSDPETHRSWSYELHSGSLLSSTLPDGSTTLFVGSVAGVRARVDANMAAGSLAGQVSLEYLDALGRVTRSESCAVLPLLEAGDQCPDSQLLSRSEVAYDALGRVTERWLWRLESQPAEPILYERNWYDGSGKLLRRDDLDTGTWLYQRDEAGRVLSFVDPVHEGATLSPRRGVVVTRYDNAGRVRKRKGRSGTEKLRQGYRYVGAGRVGEGQLERVKSKRGESKVDRRLAYNELGLVASEDIRLRTGRARSRYMVTYEYDKSGRVLSVGYPSANSAGQMLVEKLETSYSVLGRVLGLSLGDKPLVSAVEHDAWGNTTRIEYGNGLNDHLEYLPPSQNAYPRCWRSSPTAAHEQGLANCGVEPGDLRAVGVGSRDQQGRILELLDQLWAGQQLDESLRVGTAGPVAGLGGYDELGRLRELTYQQGSGSSRTEQFAYDSLGNMTASNGQAWLYDPLRPHRLVNAGGLALGWDANGRRSSKGDSTLAWDMEGNLVSSVSESGHEIRYALDQGGARVGRYDAQYGSWSQVYATHSGAVLFEIEGGQLLRYFHLAGRLVASDRVAAPDGLSLERYTPAANGQQAAWPPAGQTVYYHVDHLGSTRLISDQDGQPLRYLRHDAWGQTLAVYQREADGSLVALETTHSSSRWGFTGQRSEISHGLVDFGRRWYDPATRQFLSPDPEGQFANPRAYGAWDPLNGTDPDGGFFFPALPAVLNWAATSGIVSALQATVKSGDLGAGMRAGMASFISSGLAATGVQGMLLQPVFKVATLGNATAAAALSKTLNLATTARAGAQGDVGGVFLAMGGLAWGQAPHSAQAGSRSLAAADEVATSVGGGGQSPGNTGDTRVTDVVHLTGHRTGGIGPYHLAMERRVAGSQANWISGHTPNGGIPVLSDLFSDPIAGGMNHPSDMPSRNISIGTVAPPPGMNPGDYWDNVVQAGSNCCGTLDYALFPSRFFSGYNSNSYLAGLVQATGGTPSVDLSGFVGGGHPVPPEYFGRPRN